MLVKPFANTPISPNVFTTIRLLVGLYSAYLFSTGQNQNLAAWCFSLSHFLDHTDGELARMTGKTSRFGHYYDLSCDAIIMILTFVCISIGLHTSQPDVFGDWSIVLGIIAGVSIAVIFQLRNTIETKLGKSATQQPSFFGFEAEDILYLMPLVTMTNGLVPFLISAAIGAPIGAYIVWKQYQSLFSVNRPEK